jgi:DNA-binding HxlR family transcriptional regulator
MEAARHEAGAGEVCPHFHAAVELIGRRWNGAILWALMKGPLRFAEIRQLATGVSDRLLSERLKQLEAEGLVRRTVSPGTPVRVEYSLTQKGQALAPSISKLHEWAQHWVQA